MSRKFTKVLVAATISIGTCSQGVMLNNVVALPSIEDVKSISIINNKLSVEMVDGITDVSYSLKENEATIFDYQSNGEFIVDANKEYTLLIKINDDEPLEINVDTVAPKAINIGLEYGNYDEINNCYTSAIVTYKVSEDAKRFIINDSDGNKITDGNILAGSDKLTFTVDKNDIYKIIVYDEFDNSTEAEIDIKGITETLAIPTVSLEPIGECYIDKSNVTWAKKFTATINVDSESKYGYSFVEKGNTLNYIEDKEFNVVGNKTYEYGVINKESSVKSLVQEINISSIDNEAPVFAQKAFEFNKRKTKLTVFAEDKGCGIKKYVLSYSGNKGELIEIENTTGKFEDVPRNVLKVQVFDYLGNVSTVEIDSERPNITSTNIIYDNPVADDSGNVFGKSAKIEINAVEENKKITGYYLSDHKIEDIDDIDESFFGKSKVIDVSKKGTYFAFVKDKNSNISDGYEVKVYIDTEIPTIVDTAIQSMHEDNENYSNSLSGYKVSVVAKDNDGGVGLDSSAYSIDGVNYQKENEFLIKKNGSYIIYVKDALGNIASKEIKIDGIDSEKPVVETASILNDNVKYTNYGTYTNSDIKIAIPITEVSDNNSAISGIKDVILSINLGDKNTKNYKKPEIQGDNYIFTIKETDVSYTMSLTVVDNVGNTTEISELGYFNNKNIQITNKQLIEKNNPVIKAFNVIKEDQEKVVTYNNKLWYTEDIKIDINVTDVLEGTESSGIDKIVLKANGEEVKTENFDEFIDSYTEEISTVDLQTYIATNDNELLLELTVFDNAGNKTTYNYQLYRDFYAPKIEDVSIKATYDKNKVEYFKPGLYFVSDGQLDIGIKMTDDFSGVNDRNTYLNIQYKNKDGKTVIEKYDIVDKKGENYLFTVPLTNLFFKAYLVTEDNVGHKIYQEEIGKKIIEANGNVFDDIVIDNIAPTISTIDIVNASAKNINGKDWINQDVTLNYSVSDVVKDLDCSGLRSIKVEVNGKESSELGKFLSNVKTDEVKDIQFNTSMLESEQDGRIAIVVTAADNIGNTTTMERVLYRDLDRPTLTTSYDNNTPDQTFNEYYKENRILTLRVKEMNFDAELMNINLGKDGVKTRIYPDWNLVEGKVGTVDAVYQCQILFNEDVDYEILVDGKDKVDHILDSSFTDKFTVDKIKPTIMVSYDNNNAQNNNYYNQGRTATIVINEHNFDSSRIKVIGTATDNGAQKEFPSISSFSRNGDKNTATISYSSDALYNFDIEYTDKAGNVMDDYANEEFYVDATKPELTISGVVNESANNGEVIPVVSASDTNYDANKFNISLVGDHRGQTEIEGSKTAQANGEVFTFANMKQKKDNDDVYTIDASLTDKAGNETKSNIIYSLNRFGSTYILSDSLVRLMDNQYVKKAEPVIFDEINVNPLVENKVTISVNGQTRELEQEKDYTFSLARDKAWYRYTYNLKSSLFEKDAIYKVIVTSKDAAGNLNENIIDEKSATINFAVDKTMPTIAVAGLKANNIYNESNKKVEVSVSDNLLLDSVEVLLNNEHVDINSKDGDNLVVNIPEKNTLQTLKVIAKDKAGNASIKEISNFTVSSNFFVRWYLNKPLFIGSIFTILASVSIIATLFIKRKKKIVTSETQED